MRKTLLKPREDKVIRVNVSIHPRLIAVVPEILRRGGYSGLSDYIQARIRQDAGLEHPPGTA